MTKAVASTAVIILTYNNTQDTLACVQSVLDSAPAPAQIIIVDNASTDDCTTLHSGISSLLVPSPPDVLQPEGSAVFLHAHADRVRTLQLLGHSIRNSETGAPAQVWLLTATRNAGYAAGNNLGLLYACTLKVQNMWILNNDTLVDPHALALLKARCEDPRLGLCGALLCYTDNTVQCLAGGHTSQWTALSTLLGQGLTPTQALTISPAHVEPQLNFIYGASVMVRHDFIEKVGLMDERFFMYCEEQDWAYRARQHGFTLGYAPARVQHKEGASTGWSKHQFAFRPLWLLTRARLLLTAKHHPLALPCVCAAILYAAVRMALRRLRSIQK